MPILLENGAKVNVNDFDGETPLSCAVFHDGSDSVHLLLNHGANVHSLDNAVIRLLYFQPLRQIKLISIFAHKWS
jgi:ankyrin repeat protein